MNKSKQQQQGHSNPQQQDQSSRSSSREGSRSASQDQRSERDDRSSDAINSPRTDKGQKRGR
jgi:hypothetical protein